MHDFSVKFGGQGYKFEVFVNTNEPPEDVALRLQKAARGQVKAACAVVASKLTPEGVTKFMKALADTAASGAGIEHKI